ncbi:hypothetical protein DYB34_007384 [Aphanomyces astaci]|uniref:ABC transporter domain-containing protein n=1 Tax=Aphanomyces astaci TaxID=112090 RepID=A0A418C7F9_APHAT|nr:hypothetical protein DYB34_007384 [Aphanomyces astaci]
MDQLTNALAFANCSITTTKAHELILDVGAQRRKELELVDTQYSNALLGVSFVTVFGICLCSLYAFYRSHMFHLHVRAEIAHLGTFILVQLFVHHCWVATTETKSLPAFHGTLMDHAMDKSPTAGPCTISFAYLSYFVQETSLYVARAPEKQIMHDASGTFKPGRLTAIMGPSGSGKTTLLNLVSGRVFTGSYYGYRLLNHELTSPTDYDVFMSSQGYVEQTDTFIETMTVRESLLFSAYLRLPDSMTLREKIERVQTILRVVQLDDAANTIIGGLLSGLKGLSGGQKRRLSIATELLRLPSVLILDEPTSGLDSTSSLLLVQMLASLANQQGLTVVSTIHQPRAEIFDLFHDVVLMDKGGFLIYCGPSHDAKTHLAAMGSLTIHPDTYINPADFIIDALGLDPEKEATKLSALQVATTTDSSPFLNHWKASSYFATLMQSLAHYSDVPAERRVYKVPKQSWIHVQTWTCFERRYSRLYGKKIDLLYKIGQSNALSYYPYVYAAFLIETFEGVVNSIVLMTVALVLHNWNGLTPRSIFSLYLIFILSTLAWQSIVCFASSVSHRTPVVYSVLFMVLGVGFLFSGVCVGYDDMAPIWYWSYFGMAPALMARSLIVASTSSDLQVQMLVSSSMLNMSLDAMFGVLVASIGGFRYVCELLAIAVFYWREYHAKQLKFKSVDWIEARLRSFA